MRGLVLALVLFSSPAFAQSVPGCHDGRLTDPRAYFYSLIGRAPGDVATDYVGVLAQVGLKQGPGVGIKAGDEHYGITQQIAAEGPRGVLFLPTDLPDENGFYTRQILVVDGTNWTWVERFPSRPPYAPRTCASMPVEPPPATGQLPVQDPATLTRIEAKLDAHEAAEAAERAKQDAYREEVRQTWVTQVKPVFSFLGKYIVPAVIAFLGGKAL